MSDSLSDAVTLPPLAGGVGDHIFTRLQRIRYPNSNISFQRVKFGGIRNNRSTCICMKSKYWERTRGIKTLRRFKNVHKSNYLIICFSRL